MKHIKIEGKTPQRKGIKLFATKAKLDPSCAWDYLRWEDIQPIEKNRRILAATLVVYSGTKDEYRTFITAEAYTSLKEWMDSREKAGERITYKSWLMRDLWKDRPTKKGGVQQRGIAPAPKKLSSVREILNLGMFHLTFEMRLG